MNKKTVILVGLLLLCLLLGRTTVSTQANMQGPVETAYPEEPVENRADLTRNDQRPPHPGAIRTRDGHWIMPVSSTTSTPEQDIDQASGGPDDYGYTWSDNVPFNWVDASGATDTGLSISTGGSVITNTPIPLGFDFRFYENIYSQLYISSAGSVGFSFMDLWGTNTPTVPSPATPNNIISAYLAPLKMNSAQYDGRVLYQRLGNAPNRRFVVTWDGVEDGIGGIFTFQIILHENGDIILQYLSMDHDNSYYCGTFVGIEDSMGLDGLAYLSSACNWVEGLTASAVRFTRPAPAARVSVNPRHQGSFIRANETVELQFSVRNTGELGPDTYDITANSAWPLSLYAADGVTPLTDNDGDGIQDTGSLMQNAERSISIQIQVPGNVTEGTYERPQLIVRSSLDVNKAIPLNFDLSVPAPFVQTYQEREYPYNVTVQLNHPAGRTQQSFAGLNDFRGEPALSEMPNNNYVLSWYEGRCSTNCNTYGYELYYSIFDPFGQIVVPETRLTDHTNAGVNTYDLPPAVAVSPGNQVGLLWQRELYNQQTGASNYNVYFAIVDGNGALVHGPENVTNNQLWGDFNSYQVPYFYAPSIAATADNRFMLAWERQEAHPPAQNCDYCYVNDVYRAVRSATGAIIRLNERVTADTPGYEDYYGYPNLTSAGGNNVFLMFERSGSNPDIYGMMLNSNGDIVTGMTNISGNGNSAYDFQGDAVRLSSGNFLLAWNTSIYPDYELSYALINDGLARLGPIHSLQHPDSVYSYHQLSVTSAPGGNGIVTWNDVFVDTKLYYAHIAGDGSLITPPSIFAMSDSGFNLGGKGYTNAPYSLNPPGGVDGVLNRGAALTGGSPGGFAPVPLSFANHGAQTATGVVISATLDADLTYAGDTLGISPDMNGQTLSWNVPDVSFLERESFVLYVTLPDSASIGERFSVQAALLSDQQDANTADNQLTVNIMSSDQVLLPAFKQH